MRHTEAMTSAPSRALSNAIEPFAGQVYFSPECHRGYAALGFGASPATTGGVEMPDGPAYFCSRGSALGQAPGEVIAATFAVFNPAVVVPAVGYGWTLTDAPTIRAARTEGAVAQLRRVLGAAPDGVGRAVELLRRAADGLSVAGKPLFAGVVADGLAGEPLTDAWLLADRLREFRGDAHVNAWVAAGFDAVEIGLITELYRGFPPRTYVRSRAWSDDELTAGEARLAQRDLARDGVLSDAGRAAREAIETATDAACAPIVVNLGDDLGELVELVGGWSKRLLDAGAFPKA
ncbi:hypothetical protein ABW16_14455 [Mycolicibacter heraklionensis]|uniref:SalK n=2 Tax=Mycolicibacter heraklionensis TaxID=512402 RepID=A0ABR5FE35_9MYCO|nr:hypothetical protein ABW16_14455 [Mycolicibacter heraklionensis]